MTRLKGKLFATTFLADVFITNNIFATSIFLNDFMHILMFLPERAVVGATGTGFKFFQLGPCACSCLQAGLLLRFAAAAQLSFYNRLENCWEVNQVRLGCILILEFSCTIPDHYTTVSMHGN